MDDELLKRTEVEGFLRTIRENPQDNTNRLVFADWLDDNGEPDLALKYRRSYAELYQEIVDLCNRYDETRGYRTYGRMDPDDLIQQALDCATGADATIHLGAAEDLTYALRERGEEWAEFWRTVELLTGHVVHDDVRQHTGYRCGC